MGDKNKYKVPENSYINIQAFMVNELGLKDKELLVYALIYGFTQDGDDWFTGSMQYIGNWLGVESKNVYPRYLKPLVDNGLLIKKEEKKNNQIFPMYKAVFIPQNQQKHDSNSENKGDHPQNEGGTLKMRGVHSNDDDPTQNEGGTLKMSTSPTQNEGGTTLKMSGNNLEDNLEDNLDSDSVTNNTLVNCSDLSKTNKKETETDTDSLSDIDFLNILDEDHYRDFIVLLEKIRNRELNSSKDSLIRSFRKMYKNGWTDSKGEPIRNTVSYVIMNFVCHDKQKQAKEKALVASGYEPGSSVVPFMNEENSRNDDDMSLPVYDTSNNKTMSEEEEKELLALMGRKDYKRKKADSV